MFLPYDNYNAFGASGLLTASSLAWLMFTQTGETGYFMLYSDLKEDRTLE